MDGELNPVAYQIITYSQNSHENHAFAAVQTRKKGKPQIYKRKNKRNEKCNSHK